MVFAGQTQAFGSVLGFQDVVTLTLEVVLDQLEKVRFIIDDEDRFLWHTQC
jgi:hypothetical protein